MNDLERGSGFHVGRTPAGRFARWVLVPVVGVLVLCAAVPALASARVGWRLNGTPLTESVGNSWKGKVKLADTKASVPMTVECEETAEGSSGTGGAGEVTKWTMSGCVGLEGCGKTGVEVTSLNLPWHSELAVVEGTLRDVLASGGKGTPGFKLVCKVLGLRVEDECSGTLRPTT